MTTTDLDTLAINTIHGLSMDVLGFTPEEVADTARDVLAAVREG